MRTRDEQRVQRVAPTTQTPDGSDRFDYADAFEIRLRAPDERPAEEWMRFGLEQAPRPLRWTILVAHRFVLGFRLAPRSEPGNILGWRIVSSVPDLTHLQASSPLIVGDLVARRDNPLQMTLLTYLSFKRRILGRLVWAIAGPMHRRIAPYLLERAAGARDRRIAS